MKYLFIIILVFIFVIIISTFFLSKENFSQDIKKQGQTLIDSSKKSLTGYFMTVQNISKISDPTLKSNIQSSIAKFGTPQQLENNIIGVTKTLNCEDGNFMNPDLNYTSTCNVCQPSFYCVNAQKYLCPTNTWSNAGATGCLNLNQCPPRFMCTNKIQENCPTGYFCNEGISIICSAGAYCVSGSKTVCPTGTFNEKTGRYLSTDCLSCPTGSFCLNGNKNICPIGSYCTNGNRNICSEGTYNTTTGNTSASSCINCPAGSFCSSGQLQKCGTSTWSDAGASFCNYREKVPPGYQYDQSYFGGDYKNDQNHVKIPCDPGYYCMTGFRLPCPTKTWSDSLQSSCTPLSECPEGSACNNRIKTSCVPGTWSSKGQTECKAVSECPAGSMCDNLVQRSCVSGTTWSDKGQLKCMSVSDCPTGSACANGVRVLCGTGTWSDKGQLTCTANTQCPPGYYITYNNRTGTFTGGIKVLCPEGSYCVNGNKIPCTSGYYSTSGSSYCVSCPPGSACKNGIRTICGTGSYSPGGLTTDCQYCPIMARTTDSGGYVTIVRNNNVKTLDNSGKEVYQGATQCKLANNNDRCSAKSQCGAGSDGKQMSCCYWKGSALSSYSPGYRCADFNTWTDWGLSGSYWDKCMTGPAAETRYPYLLNPGEYNYDTSTISG